MDYDIGNCNRSTASSNSTQIRYRPPFQERFGDFPEALCNEMVRTSLIVMKKYMDELVECIFGSQNGFCTPCTDELSWVTKTASKAGIDVGKYEALVMQVREEEERLRSARTGIFSQFYGSQVRVNNDDDYDDDYDDDEYFSEIFERLRTGRSFDHLL